MSDAEVTNAAARIPTDFLKENVVFVEHAKNIATLSVRLAQGGMQFTDDARDLRYLRQQTSTAQRQLLEGIVPMP